MNNTNLRNGKRALNRSAGWPLRAVTGYLNLAHQKRIIKNMETLKTFELGLIAALLLMYVVTFFAKR